MGLSWSAMRKILEQENICDSLRGRIQYFATRYRKSHDQEGRVAIRLDGNEIFKSDFYDWDILRLNTWQTKENIIQKKVLPYFGSKRMSEIGAKDVIQWQNEMMNYRGKDGKPFSATYLAWDEVNASKGRKTSYAESGEQMELGALNKGGFQQFSFYNAFHTYHNSSTDDSLQSPDPMVRLFAILDKRVGKRRLQNILTEIESQPEWLQVFYRLRLEADGIIQSSLPS